MTHKESSAVQAIERYYIECLARRPGLRRKLDALGLANAELVAMLRIGYCDGGAGRALRAGWIGDSTSRRSKWLSSGLVDARGRERLRGHFVVPLGEAEGGGGWIGLRAWDAGARGVHATEIVPNGGAFFLIPGAQGRGEAMCCGDLLDGLALHSATGAAVLTGIRVSPDRWACKLGAMSTIPQPLRGLQLVFGSTPEGKEARDAVEAAADRLGVGTRAFSLPAGCSIRDVLRLHGPEGVRAALEGRVARFTSAVRATEGLRSSVLGKWRSSADTFSAALVRYVDALEGQGRATRDCREIAYRLERFRYHCEELGHASLAQLSRGAVEDVQRHILKSEGLRSGSVPGATAYRQLAAARRFLAWASGEGYLPTEALTGFGRLPRPAVMPPPVLSEDEVERVLSRIDRIGVNAVRDRAMAEVLYSTGLRRAELVGLDVKDIDHLRRAVTVCHGKGRKTRVVPIGRRALEWVDRYLHTRRRALMKNVWEPALFLGRSGNRMTVKTLTARMRGHLSAAGLVKRGSCHVFRHSAATLMHDAGADIRDLQALLGHALLTSTQIYTRVSVARLLEVHARTHPAERGYPPG